jgi:hypothetical protein
MEKVTEDQQEQGARELSSDKCSFFDFWGRDELFLILRSQYIIITALSENSLLF